uniref:Protein indeterminate-domain 2-like n=1 Tax=Rhizophora mucronata TaxID=61149 RepID=A0A2P2QHI1_RHIMU
MSAQNLHVLITIRPVR